MTPLTVTQRDERKIRADFPLNAIDTEQLGKNLVHAGQDGYELVTSREIQGGHQRDPITVGVELTLIRP